MGIDIIAADEKTRPDAVMVPRPFFGMSDFDTHQHFRRVLGPILGTDFVFARAQQNQYFITRHPDDSLLFPALTPLYPEERYHWFVAATGASGPFELGEQVGSWRGRPEVIKFGYLRDPDSIKAPSAATKAEFDRDRTAYVLRMREKVTRFKELIESRERGEIDSAQMSELAALESELT
jgi:hypothetical protein